MSFSELGNRNTSVPSSCQRSASVLPCLSVFIHPLAGCQSFLASNSVLINGVRWRTKIHMYA